MIAPHMWQTRQGEPRDARSIATTAFVPRRDDIQNNRACIAINTQGALAALLLRPVAAHVHVPSAANRHGCKADCGVAVSSLLRQHSQHESGEDMTVLFKKSVHMLSTVPLLHRMLAHFWLIHAVVRIHDLILPLLSKCT